MNLSSILQYFTKSHHTIQRDDVKKSLEDVMLSIDNEIIPAIDAMLASADLKAVKNAELIKLLAYSSGMKNTKDVSVILETLKTTFKMFSDSEKTISSLVEKYVPTTSMDRATSARTASIIRLINDIGSMSLYLLDVLYVAVFDQKETEYPKVKIKAIEDNVDTFGSLYKTYGAEKAYAQLLKDLPEVSDTPLDMTSTDTTMLSLLANDGKEVNLPTVAGFIGNPIYHIRMWWVDRQIEKYTVLKTKRKALEARLLELKQQEEQNSSPELRGAIEFYEKEIVSVEYKMKEIEG